MALYLYGKLLASESTVFETKVAFELLTRSYANICPLDPCVSEIGQLLFELQCMNASSTEAHTLLSRHSTATTAASQGFQLSTKVKCIRIFKEKGNSLFIAREYDLALKKFEEKQFSCLDSPTLKFLARQMKREHYDQVIFNCTKALSFDATSLKVYYRRAIANEWKETLLWLSQILTLFSCCTLRLYQ